MGYANPIERYGVERFVADAQAAGVDGVLVVDYPPEECAEFAALLQGARHRSDLPARADLDRRAHRQRRPRSRSGYVYYVSLKGVTGAGHFDIDAVAAMMPRIKAHVKLPVGVGFGIRDAATARAVAEVADAVVIGSALVQLLEGADARRSAAAWRGASSPSIRAALDAARYRRREATRTPR